MHFQVSPGSRDAGTVSVTQGLITAACVGAPGTALGPPSCLGAFSFLTKISCLSHCSSSSLLIAFQSPPMLSYSLSPFFRSPLISHPSDGSVFTLSKAPCLSQSHGDTQSLALEISIPRVRTLQVK